MNRLLFGMTLALTAAAACGGGDDSTNPSADSGGGGSDASMVADSSASDSRPGADSSPGTDSDAAKFSVSAVPGLALWLDAAKDVTLSSGKVSKWHDQSGNNNDAIQSVASLQPSPLSSSINGLPGVQFTATVKGQTYGNMMGIGVPVTPTLDWSTGDYLIEVVGLYHNTTQSGSAEEQIGAGTFYSKQWYTGNGPLQVKTGPALYGNVYSVSSPTTGYSGFADQSNFLASTTTGYNDGKGHLFAVERVGTTLSLRLNGAQTDSKVIASLDVDLGDPSGTPPSARIGASGNATIYRLDGDIDEMIAVKGPISSADLSGIESYLMTKYGL